MFLFFFFSIFYTPVSELPRFRSDFTCTHGVKPCIPCVKNPCCSNCPWPRMGVYCNRNELSSSQDEAQNIKK